MVSLKEGYNEEYKCTCLALAFAIVLFSPNLVSTISSLMPEINGSLGSLVCYAAFLALAYVLGITVDALVPCSLKESMLFPSKAGRGVLKPGCRVFTNIKDGKVSDSRFNIKDAREVYKTQIERCGKLSSPELALYQNTEWYTIYQRNSSALSVKANNLGYLYCRDVFVLSLILTVAGVAVNVVCFVLGMGPLVGCVSIFIILVMSILSWISAHIKARRLAYTVISCDLANAEGEK